MKPDKKTLGAVLLVLLIVVGGAVAYTTLFTAGSGTSYETGSGLVVETNTDHALDGTNPFVDNETVYIDGVSFSAAGSGTVTVDQFRGSRTNLSGIDASSTTITVDPDDKSAVRISGSVTALSWEDAAIDGTSQISYSASGTGTIVATGLEANTSYAAATTSGEVLTTGTTTTDGEATINVDAATEEDVVLLEPNAPVFDEASAIPQGNEKLDSREVELSIPMNDTDFASASGDTVTVDFYFDGEIVDTQTVSQNQTLSTEVTVSQGGAHDWHVEGTDEYGLTTTSSTFSFQAPSELRIYNESAPDTLVNDVTVEIQFYGGQDGDSFTVQREATDGTIDMSGLPVDQEFIVVANAEGYNNRRIYVESLYEQANVFLLPESVQSVYNVFRVDDKSGSYSPEDSRIIIQRALNRSGNFTWHTISGDFFGSTNEHKTYLKYNVRYRLIVVNDAGQRRMMGPYFATDESNPKVISISSIVVEPPEGQSYYGTAWIEDEDEEDNKKVLRFSYTDPDELTDDLELVIHERGNVSNEIANITTTDVGDKWAYTYTLTGNETEKTWVVDWKGQRDGQEIGQKYPVGEEGSLGLPMGEWLTRFALVALPIVAALSSERIATLGAMGTVAFAGILMITGIWEIPVVLWFAALIIAVGGHGLTMARRGSVYG